MYSGVEPASLSLVLKTGSEGENKEILKFF